MNSRLEELNRNLIITLLVAWLVDAPSPSHNPNPTYLVGFCGFEAVAYFRAEVASPDALGESAGQRDGYSSSIGLGLR